MFHGERYSLSPRIHESHELDWTAESGYPYVCDSSGTTFSSNFSV